MAVSAEELGMVAADSRTKANHHFKFRAIGAVTAQLHGSFVARTIPELNRLSAVAADAVSPTSFHSRLNALPAKFWPCGLQAAPSLSLLCAMRRWPTAGKRQSTTTQDKTAMTTNAYYTTQNLLGITMVLYFSVWVSRKK